MPAGFYDSSVLLPCYAYDPNSFSKPVTITEQDDNAVWVYMDITGECQEVA